MACRNGKHLIITHHPARILTLLLCVVLRTFSVCVHLPVPQGWRFFPTSLHDASVPHIGPGDRVLTRCTYNTVGRNNVTR